MYGDSYYFSKSISVEILNLIRQSIFDNLPDEVLVRDIFSYSSIIKNLLPL